MARRITSDRGRLFYVATALPGLVLLIISIHVFDWSNRLVSLGTGLVCLGNLVMLVVILRSGSSRSSWRSRRATPQPGEENDAPN